MTETNRDDTHRQQEQQQQEGGRGGETREQGGASKQGHLSPQIDIKGDRTKPDGQIAQDRQQSSGQGSGQT